MFLSPSGERSMNRWVDEHTCPSADAVRQRAIAGGLAVLSRRRPDADLWPDADREFRPRRALYAGRLRRLLAQQLVGQLLARPGGSARVRRAFRCGVRIPDPAPALTARWPRLPDGDLRPRPGPPRGPPADLGLCRTPGRRAAPSSP